MSDERIRYVCTSIAEMASRHRILVISAAALATLIAVALMGRLTISGDLEDVVGDASPAAAAMSHMADRFHVSNDLLVVVEARSAASPAHARASLIAFAQALERALLANDKGAVEGVSYRHSTATREWLEQSAFDAALLLLNDASFETFESRLTSDGVRSRIRRIETLLAAPGPLAQSAAGEAIADPFDVRGLLIEQMQRGVHLPAVNDELALSDDGLALLIRISPSSSDLTAYKQLVERTNEAIRRVDAADIDVALTGAPAIAAFSATSIRADLIRSVIGAAVAIQVLLVIVYRGAWLLPLVLAPTLVAIAWAFGVVSLIESEITALSAAVGAMLIGLGVDYAVHTASTTHEGPSPRGVRAVGLVGPGVIGAGVTSIIGFAALSTSHLKILSTFALIGVVGLGFAVFAAFMLMPTCLRPGVGPRRTSARALTRRPKRWLAASGLVSLLAAATIILSVRHGSLIRIDDDLAAMHPQPNPALAAQEVVDERFSTSAEGLPVLITADDDDALLTRAHALSGALSNQSAVSAVIGIDRLLPDPQALQPRLERLGAIDINDVRTRIRRALSDSLLAPQALDDALLQLETMLQATHPATVTDLRESARSDLLAADGSSAAVSLILLHDPIDGRADRNDTVSLLRNVIQTVPGAALTGPPVLAHDVERLALREAPRLLAVASFGVLVWLALFFRRPVDMLLSILPGAFAAVVLLAAAALLDIRLNIVNMAAIPLLVGIGVDDGIFLVAASRGREGDVKDRIGQVTHAIITTSLTTLLAFGSLVFTSTPAIASLGLLVCIGVAGCLWGSLFILAPILMLRDAARGGAA